MDKKESALSVSATDLLNAGVHFGHQSKRWNPKMKRFIFEKRSGIYIIDLTKTVAQLESAARFLYETVASGKNVVFVGTKRQAQEIVREDATKSGQHYVVSRWLGGTLTNYQNIANSIQHMKDIQAMREKGELDKMPQKEASRLRHELERLERNLMGIAEMKQMPGAMIVVDINREAIAVREANRAGIPVVALVDTNCDPDPVNYPIPANDDSARSIKIIINVLADAIMKALPEFAQARVREQAREAAKPRVAEHKPSGRTFRDRKPRRGSTMRNRTGAARHTETKKAEEPAETGKAPETSGAEPQKQTANLT